MFETGMRYDAGIFVGQHFVNQVLYTVKIERFVLTRRVEGLTLRYNSWLDFGELHLTGSSL